MKAEDTLVTNLLEGAKQFIVPIFQRDYSWGTRHCQQLWKGGAIPARQKAPLPERHRIPRGA
jgi:hypothetical protein